MMDSITMVPALHDFVIRGLSIGRRRHRKGRQCPSLLRCSPAPQRQYPFRRSTMSAPSSFTDPRGQVVVFVGGWTFVL